MALAAVLGMEAMSDTVGPGDLVLCVNAAPNHATGRPVPLQAGETYRVITVMEFACPCGRSDALLDIGIDFAWCQTRFRLLPKPKAMTKTRRASALRRKRRFDRRSATDSAVRSPRARLDRRRAGV